MARAKTVSVSKSPLFGYEQDLGLPRYLIVSGGDPRDESKSRFFEPTIDSAVAEARELALDSRKRTWSVFAVRCNRWDCWQIEAFELMAMVSYR